MEIIPAVDIKSGRCVRLYQGNYQQETVYSDDPIATARGWQERGARRLHVVDLDGAEQGRPVNLGIISSIAEELDIPVQVGGGIRSAQVAHTLLESGVGRVVLGTAAVRDQNLVTQLLNTHGTERVVVAVDAQNGQVSIEGWKRGTSVGAYELVGVMEGIGVARFIYTDISRDGTLSHPNFEAINQLVKRTGPAVIASGGVSSARDIERLSTTGIEGVIVGKALYTGDLDLAEALEAAGSTSEGIYKEPR